MSLKEHEKCLMKYMVTRSEPKFFLGGKGGIHTIQYISKNVTFTCTSLMPLKDNVHIQRQEPITKFLLSEIVVAPPLLYKAQIW